MSFINNNLDIPMISEAKIDDTFPDSQFLIHGFLLPYRLDRINLRNKKWLLGRSYNPHRSNITPHLRNISTALDKRSTDYENVILLGNFNVEVEEKNLSNLKTFIKQKNLF